MSMATASILALLARSRFQSGFSASAPLPSPTKTTAPLSRSMTMVRKRYPRPTQISSMAICRRCLSLGLAKRRLKRLGVVAPGVGEGNLDLADDAAGPAARPWDGKDDRRVSASDGQATEAPLDVAFEPDIAGATRRAATGLGLLADGENHFTLS